MDDAQAQNENIDNELAPPVGETTTPVGETTTIAQSQDAEQRLEQGVGLGDPGDYATSGAAAGAAVTPTYPDLVGADDSGWAAGILVGLGLLLAAVAAVFFLYNADSSESALVASAAAEPTTVPASPTPIPATATAEPAPDPTAVPAAAPFLLSDLAGETSNISALAGAVGELGLADALAADGPLTVFAPSDDAFDAFVARAQALSLSEDQIRAIVAHHVVAGEFPSDVLPDTALGNLRGGSVFVSLDGSLTEPEVIEADLRADNGVMHVVDEVSIPGSVLNLHQRLQFEDGVDTADTLFTQTGVDEILQGPGPITAFVPSDFGVSTVPDDALALVQANADEVTRYHIVEGEFRAADLTPGTALTTIQGEQILVGDNAILNGDTTVVSADLEASNGVAHIIDGVLVPGTIATEAALNSLFVLEPVQFEVGSAAIVPESQLILDEAVAVLITNPVGAVQISGHTDTDGSEEANLALSQARADSVLSYLVNGGVDANRLTAVGFGETEVKVDPEVTPEDKAQNRRIEFLVENT